MGVRDGIGVNVDEGEGVCVSVEVGTASVARGVGLKVAVMVRQANRINNNGNKARKRSLNFINDHLAGLRYYIHRPV